ncbi:extensin family protein [Devosia rhodophyticola]|uniref:Extensin family protein n=1 Tax=Devosia rhodophyticola TaxID=3026423 RepID=A0ABY7Z0X8_9HYPH|nr:extensin family protein [Devosia rhodophyticola]WDR07114.1 extensin family protein [Devosia rhodophyticola]
MMMSVALTGPVGAAEVALPRPRPAATKPVIVPPEVTKPEVEAKPAVRLYQTACPAVINGQVEAKALPPISEGVCEARSPLSVTKILANGRLVALSNPIITDCAMASSLPGWVAAIDGYLGAVQNTQLETIVVGTSYMCRKRNNAADGLTSEHGFADALDVVGFAFGDGTAVSLTKDWLPAEGAGGRLLRLAHDAACARFTTVLGPEANALHRDHLHLDLGCHGKTCTARLCE